MTTRAQKRRNYNKNKSSRSRALKWSALFDTEIVRDQLSKQPHPSVSALNYYDYCKWMYLNGYNKGTLPAVKQARRADPTPLDREKLIEAWHESEMVYQGPDRDGFPYCDYTDQELKEVYL